MFFCVFYMLIPYICSSIHTSCLSNRYKIHDTANRSCSQLLTDPLSHGLNFAKTFKLLQGSGNNNFVHVLTSRTAQFVGNPSKKIQNFRFEICFAWKRKFYKKVLRCRVENFLSSQAKITRKCSQSIEMSFLCSFLTWVGIQFSSIQFWI